MYHIKNDKRVKESAKLIVEGLNRCLTQKKFEELTITDVQKESTVGRATFYRLFDSLKDVLLYECDITFFELMKKSINEDTILARIEIFIDGWILVSDLLETIVSSGNIDIIYLSHLHCIDLLKENLYGFNDIEDKEYFVSVLTSLMVGILVSWLKKGKKETASQLTEILRKTVSYSYKMLG